MTAAAKPKPRKSESQLSEIDRLALELSDAKGELALLNRFLEKIQSFSTIVGEAKKELKRLKEEERDLAEQLKELRSDIKSVEGLIDCSNTGMLSLIEPGPQEFLPLFDKMEKADQEVHGKNAGTWREQPLSMLKLSPASTALLYEAEILFIGQLQDRIIQDPDTWWSFIEGLTLPIAAAIADKLEAFSKKGGDV